MKLKKVTIMCFLILLFTITSVSASDNFTDINDISEEIESGDDKIIPADNLKNTIIESENVNVYYKEKCDLTGYLKDNDNKAISNKKVSITVNKKTYGCVRFGVDV